MTESHDTSRQKRSDPSAGQVADLASRAIAELAARRSRMRAPLSERLIVDLVAASLDLDDARLGQTVETLLASQIPPEEIVDLYIPEAARRLGDEWCSDGLSFAEVTIGSARLQRYVRELSLDMVPLAGDVESSAILIVRDGEFHTMGAMVAASQLRRKGVSVRLAICEPDSKVITAIAAGQHSAVLFSVGATEMLGELHDFVAKLRKVAPSSAVFGLGGAVGHLGEEAIQLTGVDFVSTDAGEVIRRCGLKTSIKGARRRATSV